MKDDVGSDLWWSPPECGGFKTQELRLKGLAVQLMSPAIYNPLVDMTIPFT